VAPPTIACTAAIRPTFTIVERCTRRNFAQLANRPFGPGEGPTLQRLSLASRNGPFARILLILIPPGATIDPGARASAE